MTAIEAIPVRTMTHGIVPETARELAVAKVRSELGHVTRPVLSARVTLTMSADPAVAHPAAGPRPAGPKVPEDPPGATYVR